jgi:L-2,4-diaminobutyric acid acetyltransferase
MLRQPRAEDAVAIKRLVEASGVLDVNSLYCYLLLCSHFESTCVVAEVRGELMGFTTGYLLPGRPDVFFVWQIGVHESARGKGLAASMLDGLMARDSCANVRFLEATVTPTNEASKALFRSFARRFGTACTERPCFNENVFGEQAHEVENLLRIGPLPVGQGRNQIMEALKR